MKNNSAVVIGASSSIGTALIKAFIEEEEINKVYAVSRKPKPISFIDPRIHWITIREYTDQDIYSTSKEIFTNEQQPRYVVICNGILHNQELQPEKRLDDFEIDNFEKVLHVNAGIPLLWLKNICAYLGSKSNCTITAFSARVGSIGDNKLGGWHSYRASKAALNMALQCAAIELGRRAKQTKLIAFHPGTTDSPLSKPFQKNVMPEKLFKPEFVAQRLIGILENVKPDGQLSYLDWDNKEITW